MNQKPTKYEETLPFRKDLESLGLSVKEAVDFKVVIKQHSDAPFIFIKHLQKNYSKVVLRWIARSLAYSDIPVANELLEVFNLIENEDVRWEVANSILILNKSAPKASKVDTQKLLDCFIDGNIDLSLSPFIEIISKNEGKKAIPFLCSLLDMKFESITSERAIISETLIALGKLKAVDTVEKVRKFASHSDSWIRGKAKSALKKIEKAKEQVK